jgi:hypothetical protein
MMTVRQIERLWTTKSYLRLSDELLRNRLEGVFGYASVSSPAILAAAVAMIRLDELNQSGAPIFGVLLRTVLAAQESDGGWGDLVTTAWCVKALSIGRGSGAAVERGLDYLASLQKTEGIWPSAPIRRMPGDPAVSAFILFQLSDNAEFRQRVRFAEALDWFEGRANTLDEECRALWEHARLRCRLQSTRGAALEFSLA